MTAARWFALCWALCWLLPAGAAVLTLRQAELAPVAPAAPPQRVTLPHDCDDTLPGFSGTLDYRMAFASPDGENLLGVYVQRVCSNLEVFVNGQLVGSGGSMQPPLTRNCYFPQLFLLPRSLLGPGTNELRVRVAGYGAPEVTARQRAAGLSAVQVGSLAALEPAYDSQRFWNITAAQIIATSIAGLGLAMLGLWAMMSSRAEAALEAARRGLVRP